MDNTRKFQLERQEETLLSSKMLEFVESQVQSLKTPEKAWQPTDFLPHFGQQNWREEVEKIQHQSKAVHEDIYMVLVGNCITEEALPTYMSWLNRHEELCDKTGVDNHPWAKWTRYWTAEENKHGDLLNKYLYLTGRVDMKSMEITINQLIQNGFDTQTERNPYMGMVYTSFQERATRISHQKTAQLAGQAGDNNLKEVCKVIAMDEGKHETVYQSFVGKFFEFDPDQMMICLKAVFENGITMPSVEMGKDIFKFFTYMADKTGIYTFMDYIEIMKYLVKKWDIQHIRCQDSEAKAAQDYICRLPERLEKLALRKKPNTYSEQRSHLWLAPNNFAH